MTGAFDSLDSLAVNSVTMATCHTVTGKETTMHSRINGNVHIRTTVIRCLLWNVDDGSAWFARRKQLYSCNLPHSHSQEKTALETQHAKTASVFAARETICVDDPTLRSFREVGSYCTRTRGHSSHTYAAWSGKSATQWIWQSCFVWYDTRQTEGHNTGTIFTSQSTWAM